MRSFIKQKKNPGFQTISTRLFFVPCHSFFSSLCYDNLHIDFFGENVSRNSQETPPPSVTVWRHWTRRSSHFGFEKNRRNAGWMYWFFWLLLAIETCSVQLSVKTHHLVISVIVEQKQTDPVGYAYTHDRSQLTERNSFFHFVSTDQLQFKMFHLHFQKISKWKTRTRHFLRDTSHESRSI